MNRRGTLRTLRIWFRIDRLGTLSRFGSLSCKQLDCWS